MLVVGGWPSVTQWRELRDAHTAATLNSRWWACVVKGLAYDVWHFDNTLARIVTLIAIGLILLSVSFIYGRYREKIHKLL